MGKAVSDDSFGIVSGGSLLFRGKWCVLSNDDDLKRRILEEAHSSLYLVHPSGDMFYQGFEDHVWWSGMKRDTA